MKIRRLDQVDIQLLPIAIGMRQWPRCCAGGSADGEDRLDGFKSIMQNGRLRDGLPFIVLRPVQQQVFEALFTKLMLCCSCGGTTALMDKRPMPAEADTTCDMAHLCAISQVSQQQHYEQQYIHPGCRNVVARRAPSRMAPNGLSMQPNHMTKKMWQPRTCTGRDQSTKNLVLRYYVIFDVQQALHGRIGVEQALGKSCRHGGADQRVQVHKSTTRSKKVKQTKETTATLIATNVMIHTCRCGAVPYLAGQQRWLAPVAAGAP